ncbi:plasmid mobilization relaxosome protein MobC [Lachnospiraceae bacterium 54-11]
MARPKKETELKQNHPVMLRFTDTEYEIITENAKGAGLPLAEFLRKQITGKRVTVKYEIVADVPELKKLIAEFGKIGSNLNQIARHFNQGGIHSQEMRQAINQCIAEIYEMKYEVVKMAGDFHGDTETHSK